MCGNNFEKSNSSRHKTSSSITALSISKHFTNNTYTLGVCKILENVLVSILAKYSVPRAHQLQLTPLTTLFIGRYILLREKQCKQTGYCQTNR